MIWYFIIALLFMSEDALVTAATNKRYNIVGSFVAALIWPITAVIVIAYAAQNTHIEETET